MTDPLAPGGPGSPDPRQNPDDRRESDALSESDAATQPTPAPWPDAAAQPAPARWPDAAPPAQPGAWGTSAGSQPDATAPMDAPPPIAPPPPISPPPPLEAAPATAAKPGSRKAGLIAVAILVVPLAIILWAVRDNKSADDLKVGDCFNVPTATEVQTIESHPCTESHTGEVFHVATYSDDGTTYPISLSFDRFADTSCTPVFAAYVGADFDARPDLSIGYFFPTRDGWGQGDRVITCYVGMADESAMTTSLKGSGTP